MNKPLINMEEVPPVLALQTEQDPQLYAGALVLVVFLLLAVRGTVLYIPHLGWEQAGRASVIVFDADRTGVGDGAVVQSGFLVLVLLDGRGSEGEVGSASVATH